MKKTNWKVYFTLLMIFIPLVLVTVFLLPNNCIYFIYIYLILFWITYYILNHREKNKENDWYLLYNKVGYAHNAYKKFDVKKRRYIE